MFGGGTGYDYHCYDLAGRLDRVQGRLGEYIFFGALEKAPLIWRLGTLNVK